MRVLLASNSPRRRELLHEVIPAFEVVPSRFEEIVREGESGRARALRFAEGKAKEVFSRFPDAAVLGADTVVVLGGEILGKPKDGADAFRMLRLLSGKTHSVYSGVCLVTPEGERCGVEETRVTFRTLSDEEIVSYIQTGSPLDKAGAYGIQDSGFAASCDGSYSNVVGLPLERVREYCKELHL